MGFGHVLVLRHCPCCGRETRHIGSWCTNCDRDNPAYCSLLTHHPREEFTMPRQHLKVVQGDLKIKPEHIKESHKQAVVWLACLKGRYDFLWVRWF